MAMPRSAITALIPIKDGAFFIPRLRVQLNSTLANHDEVIIVNDFSTDGTWKAVQKWAAEDPRVHIINSRNPGIANALNLGFEAASNSWVARFDVDDQYLEDRIACQFKEVKPSTVAVFSDYTFQDPNLKFLGRIPTAVFPAATSVSLVSSQRTPHPVALLNRDAVLSIGGYRQKDFPAEDLSLWLRLSRIGLLASSPEPLLKYTINPLGVSSTKGSAQLAKKNELLTTIGLNISHFEYVVQNLELTLNSYDSLTFSGIRKFLLLRELSMASKLVHRDFEYSNSKWLRTIAIKSIPEFIGFGLSTAKRKKLRLLN